MGFPRTVSRLRQDMSDWLVSPGLETPAPPRSRAAGGGQVEWGFFLEQHPESELGELQLPVPGSLRIWTGPNLPLAPRGIVPLAEAAGGGAWTSVSFPFQIITIVFRVFSPVSLSWFIGRFC